MKSSKPRFLILDGNRCAEEKQFAIEEVMKWDKQSQAKYLAALLESGQIIVCPVCAEKLIALENKIRRDKIGHGESMVAIRCSRLEYFGIEPAFLSVGTREITCWDCTPRHKYTTEYERA